MRLQVVDETVNFACGSCTACCDQPWRTLIEDSKIPAIEEHDFSAYAQLSGKDYFNRSKNTPKEMHELAKGEGTRCLFLDSDGLCIIHKELGEDAKPTMCLVFPYLPVRTPVNDRISVNFGCPSVQKKHGTSLSEQREDIAKILTVTKRDPDPSSQIALGTSIKITVDESDALFEHAVWLFGEHYFGSLWERFDGLLEVLLAVGQAKSRSETDIAERLRMQKPFAQQNTSDLTPFSQSQAIPQASRFLFAATLYFDAVPKGVVSSIGLWQRLTMIPKIMTLAKLSGKFASRLLERSVEVDKMLSATRQSELEAPAEELLLRYFRARFWHQYPIHLGLPILGGIHQHIHDLNAILFYARTLASWADKQSLDYEVVSRALTLVEFHIANQERLYQKALKGWLEAQYCNLDLARFSLRMMIPGIPEPVESESCS